MKLSGKLAKAETIIDNRAMDAIQADIDALGDDGPAPNASHNGIEGELNSEGTPPRKR